MPRLQANVKRLMAGDVADLVFIDPPYNCDYSGYTEEQLTIQNDRMSDDRVQAVPGSRASVVPRRDQAGASLYVCHSSSWQREFQNALESAGFEVRCQIIWAKNTFAWGFGRYKFQHEPIFYCHIAGQSDAWYGDKTPIYAVAGKQTCGESSASDHEAGGTGRARPGNSSKAGDIAVDLFGGAGSTLIACERRGAKARLMEIDPEVRGLHRATLSGVYG